MSGFPAGTVSGAPKIRAMQIIDELEGRRTWYLFGWNRIHYLKEEIWILASYLEQE